MNNNFKGLYDETKRTYITNTTKDNKYTEVKLKTKIPLITDEDIKTIDTNFQDIVNKFVKEQIKDKDLALSQYIIKKQNDEKQDLINYLEDKIKSTKNVKFLLCTSKGKKEIRNMLRNKREAYQEILDKIKEGNYE